MPEDVTGDSLMTSIPRKPVTLRSIDLLRRTRAHEAKRELAIAQYVFGPQYQPNPDEDTESAMERRPFGVKAKFMWARAVFWFRGWMDKDAWELYREPKQEVVLVDLDVLSYAYLEIGVLETIGCLMAYFHVFWVVAGYTPSQVVAHSSDFVGDNVTQSNLDLLY